MNVLSLFDGMSCGLQALKNIGYTDINYYASEIDKNAAIVSEYNHPEIIRLGDVTKVKYINENLHSENGVFEIDGGIDLVLAGSPCQGFSYAGKQLNFEDTRSKLFFEFIRILDEIKQHQGSRPEFLLENVKMKEEYEDIITHYMKCWPIKINSRAFVAQNRMRYYWSSKTPTTVYGEKDIKDVDNSPKLIDILEDKDCVGVYTWPRGYNKGGTRFMDKMPCITTSSWQHNFLVEKEDGIRRKFTTSECEVAQGLPIGYTQSVSDNQAYKLLGNGWTVPVIEYILKGGLDGVPN